MVDWQRITASRWQELSPFVDTLCLPIAPFMLVKEELDLSTYQQMVRIGCLLEQRLTGRLLLLPTLMYCGNTAATAGLFQKLRSSGFTHILVLYPAGMDTELASIAQDWGLVSMLAVNLLDKPTPAGLDALTQTLVQQILRIWEQAAD